MLLDRVVVVVVVVVVEEVAEWIENLVPFSFSLSGYGVDWESVKAQGGRDYFGLLTSRLRVCGHLQLQLRGRSSAAGLPLHISLTCC